jgi:sec-independent protein translocase protein TatA
MSALPASLGILDVGSTEIVVIMLVALLLFGSKRMPDLARSLGKSLREFRKATSGLEAELKRAMEAPPSPPPRPATPPAAGPRSPGDPPPPEEPPEPFHYP